WRYATVTASGSFGALLAWPSPPLFPWRRCRLLNDLLLLSGFRLHRPVDILFGVGAERVGKALNHRIVGVPRVTFSDEYKLGKITGLFSEHNIRHDSSSAFLGFKESARLREVRVTFRWL